MPKYAILEIERRFLVHAHLLPDLHDLVCKTIEDRYFDAGRMRLRKITTTGSAESIFKLCKKYGATDTYEEPIVNIYLTSQEYEALRHLPGSDLLKYRYEYKFQGNNFIIDEHTGTLAGLYLCECEAVSSAALKSVVFPPFAVEDVTNDAKFAGVNLARSKTWRK